MWKVYFLKSSKKDWYYVGSTNDVSRRLNEHNSAKVLSTKAHIPLLLVNQQEFKSELEARAFEKKLKQRRLLKEKIIRTIER